MDPLLYAIAPSLTLLSLILSACCSKKNEAQMMAENRRPSTATMLDGPEGPESNALTDPAPLQATTRVSIGGDETTGKDTHRLGFALRSIWGKKTQAGKLNTARGPTDRTSLRLPKSAESPEDWWSLETPSISWREEGEEVKAHARKAPPKGCPSFVAPGSESEGATRTKDVQETTRCEVTSVATVTNAEDRTGRFPAPPPRPKAKAKAEKAGSRKTKAPPPKKSDPKSSTESSTQPTK